MYRFIVSPDVFIWTEGAEGLVYDSSSRTGFKFVNTDLVAEFSAQLNIPDNLYSIEIVSFESINDQDLRCFINHMVECGYATIRKDSEDLPLSYKPILKIQDDKNYYIWLNRQGADGEVIENLHNIIINVGSDNGHDLIACQTYFPTSSNKSFFRADDLVRFIKQAEHSHSLSEISIIGWPLTKFETDIFDRIISLAPIMFYLLIDDIFDCSQDLIKINQFGNITILVTLNKCSIDQISSFIADNPLYKYSFIAESEDDMIKYEQLLLNFTQLHPQVIPVYNGNNSQFIKSVVSITEEELLSNGPNKKDIFIHQSINLFDFGKLYILSDGEVRTNMANSQKNFKILDNLKDIIYKEITEGSSWLRKRDDLSLCSKCVYKYLCPSPSNYERLLDQNLCFRQSSLSKLT